MRKLFILAALLASGVTAEAGNIKETINFGGRSIQIEIPKKCRDLSCISVSLPGKSTDDEPETKPAPAAPAAAPAAAAAPPATAAAPIAPPPPPARNTEPARPRSEFSGSAVPWNERERIAPQTQPAAAPESRTAAVSPAPAPVAAPAAAASSESGTTALGVWQTEKKEGLVRIQECGGNLCGYSVEKDGSNGKQVLINMKPGAANKWSGTIHDTRGGGKYSSTITLRNNTTLAVQGCAFGGMFCGGETWTRAQ